MSFALKASPTDLAKWVFLAKFDYYALIHPSKRVGKIASSLT
jgi:hypothetical protein